MTARQANYCSGTSHAVDDLRGLKAQYPLPWMRNAIWRVFRSNCALETAPVLEFFFLTL